MSHLRDREARGRKAFETMPKRWSSKKTATPNPVDMAKAGNSAQSSWRGRLESLLDVAGKAGFGILLAALAAWAIGRYNNSLCLALSAERRPTVVNGNSQDDQVVLSLRLKKTGSTRVRLVGCEIAMSADGASSEQREMLRQVAEKASRALTEDFRISTQDGIALVPDDEVQFQTYFRIPRDIAPHIKVLIRGKMILMEIWRIADPDWSSSIVVLPSVSRGAADD